MTAVITVEALAGALDEVRNRSLGLLEPLDVEALIRQHSPLMSPLIWDLGHVANYEDLWLVRAITGADPARPELDDLYDAFKHPRRERPTLPILDPDGARAYAADVRGRALEIIEGLDIGADAPRLVASGFVHNLVVQHEHQHDETMLATLQLMPAPGYRPVTLPARPVIETPTADVAPEILLPGGPFVMGTSADPWVLDNERPAHEVSLAPFWLDTTAVTNAAYASFVADGGYEDARWWGADGWAWRQEAGLSQPQFWTGSAAAGWARDRFGWIEDLPLDQPVQHVCWHEADAFARWAGKRLPTEAEWEFAASWSPEGRKRRWPWGDADPTPEHATLWSGGSALSTFGPSAVTAHPAGANPWGVLGLIGDVWEWTMSDFAGHPGFESWPYREYSEVFFGRDYKVLRGGSWATHPSAIRATFRNWDYPIRRQIFAGFRCAKDA